MEALTGVSVALLTVYDMCKAVDKSMEIGDIYLEHKSEARAGNSITPDVPGTGMSNMKDALGRTIDYMRISITDRCNLRCKYCMPYGWSACPDGISCLWRDSGRGNLRCRPGHTPYQGDWGEPLVRRDCCQLVKQLRARRALRR